MKESIKEILKPVYYKLFPYKRPAQRYGYLFDSIRRIKPKNILEIGVWNGRRGVKMIKLAQELSSGEISYFGTDLFMAMNNEIMDAELSKFPPTKKEVQERLEQTRAKIHLIEGDTTKSLPAKLDSLPMMDFVFIDGGHAVDTIASDWACVERLMHKDTVVIFDDYYEDREHVGAKPVIDAIDQTQYDVKILPTQDIFKKPDGLLKINFVQVKRK